MINEGIVEAILGVLVTLNSVGFGHHRSCFFRLLFFSIGSSGAPRAMESMLTINHDCDRRGYGCGRWLWSVVEVVGCGGRWL